MPWANTVEAAFIKFGFNHSKFAKEEDVRLGLWESLLLYYHA